MCIRFVFDFIIQPYMNTLFDPLFGPNRIWIEYSRVPTPPGKSWIFSWKLQDLESSGKSLWSWKVREIKTQGPEKCWKIILENHAFFHRCKWKSLFSPLLLNLWCHLKICGLQKCPGDYFMGVLKSLGFFVSKRVRTLVFGTVLIIIAIFSCFCCCWNVL